MGPQSPDEAVATPVTVPDREPSERSRTLVGYKERITVPVPPSRGGPISPERLEKDTDLQLSQRVFVEGSPSRTGRHVELLRRITLTAQKPLGMQDLLGGLWQPDTAWRRSPCFALPQRLDKSSPP